MAMTEAISPANAQRNNIADIYPLSPMQEGILFHSVTATGSGLYMPQTVIRLVGPVDGDALKAAWQAAIDRHPILRSAFYWEERDQPFQVVFRHLPICWTELDWRDAGDMDIDARLTALQAANRATPFDLRQPPLMRLQWIRLATDRSILVACFHHIVLDGWSMKQLFNEAVSLYLREIGAAAPPLPAARPYSDYIGWLKRQDRAASLRFWQDCLAGTTGATRLLTGESVERFERLRRDCPDDLRLQLKEVCAALGITLNTLLQGALGLMIARQTGRNDVIFGTTTSGRPGDLPGATTMVGLFINTLPVRVTLDRQMTVAAWLRALQARQAATSAHEHVPLRKIQGSGSALFDTLLVVENIAAEVEGDRALPFRIENGDFDERTHFPLTIWVMPKADNLTFFAGHGRDTVEPASIEAFMETFVALLRDLAEAREQMLGAFVDRMSPVLNLDGLVQPGESREAEPTFHSTVAAVVASPTATERLVLAAWVDVLKVDDLDANANFFTLGGHSLLAARVVSRLRRELSVEIPVRSLFDRPVLRDLAAHIDALKADGRSDEAHVEIEI